MSEVITELTLKLRVETEQISKLNTELKERKANKTKLENSILEAMDDMGNGMRSLSTNAGTVSIKKLVIAKVEDWDVFYDYIYDNRAFHMLERRPANAAFREMLEQNQEVPGLKPFTKRSISLTKGN